MGKPMSSTSTYYTRTAELLKPLCLCYRSLKETGTRVLTHKCYSDISA